MSDLKTTGQTTSNIELQDLTTENNQILASKVLDCIKENDCQQQPKLSHQAICLATNDISAEEQRTKKESRKAVDFKAKALFELEQVIIEIEHLKQIDK